MPGGTGLQPLPFAEVRMVGMHVKFRLHGALGLCSTPKQAKDRDKTDDDAQLSDMPTSDAKNKKQYTSVCNWSHTYTCTHASEHWAAGPNRFGAGLRFLSTTT